MHCCSIMIWGHFSPPRLPFRREPWVGEKWPQIMMLQQCIAPLSRGGERRGWNGFTDQSGGEGAAGRAAKPRPAAAEEEGTTLTTRRKKEPEISESITNSGLRGGAQTRALEARGHRRVSAERLGVNLYLRLALRSRWQQQHDELELELTGLKLI